MSGNQILNDNPLRKIISGGQSGVNHAALDAAIDVEIPIGGWCPDGRLAEDRGISEKYPLDCTPTQLYNPRAEWNVRDSDGRLILSPSNNLSDGTAYTH